MDKKHLKELLDNVKKGIEARKETIKGNGVFTGYDYELFGLVELEEKALKGAEKTEMLRILAKHSVELEKELLNNYKTLGDSPLLEPLDIQIDEGLLEFFEAKEEETETHLPSLEEIEEAARLEGIDEMDYVKKLIEEEEGCPPDNYPEDQDVLERAYEERGFIDVQIVEDSEENEILYEDLRDDDDFDPPF